MGFLEWQLAYIMKFRTNLTVCIIVELHIHGASTPLPLTPLMITHPMNVVPLTLGMGHRCGQVDCT